MCSAMSECTEHLMRAALRLFGTRVISVCICLCICLCICVVHSETAHTWVYLLICLKACHWAKRDTCFCRCYCTNRYFSSSTRYQMTADTMTVVTYVIFIQLSFLSITRHFGVFQLCFDWLQPTNLLFSEWHYCFQTHLRQDFSKGAKSGFTALTHRFRS